MCLTLSLCALRPAFLRMTSPEGEAGPKDMTLCTIVKTMLNCLPRNDVIILHFLEANLFLHTLFANFLGQKWLHFAFICIPLPKAVECIFFVLVV